MAEITYIYTTNKEEHIEVGLTGRSASKNIPRVGKSAARKDKLIEIQPINLEDGRWKRFVREAELLEIKGDKDDSD